jgi:hypothetical protein
LGSSSVPIEAEQALCRSNLQEIFLASAEKFQPSPTLGSVKRRFRTENVGSCIADAVLGSHDFQRRRAMLYTVAVVLLILWLLGFVSGYTMGAFVHVLLVVAIVLFLVGLLSGRRVV